MRRTLQTLLASAPLLTATAFAAPAPPTPQPAPPAASAPAPAPLPPAEQERIYHGEAASILGRMVHGPQDQSIGRIVDVLVDDGGSPRAAIIDVGGFMGMGTRRIAVAWRALQFKVNTGTSGRIVLDMTLDQIKGIPDFKHPATFTDPPATVAAPPAPK